MSNFERIEKVRQLGNEFSEKQAVADQYFNQHRARINDEEINKAYWDLESAASEACGKYSHACADLAKSR